MSYYFAAIKDIDLKVFINNVQSAFFARGETKMLF